MQLNDRVALSREKLSALSGEMLHVLIDGLLEELGEPASELEGQALDALKSQDYDAAKRACLLDPCNEYLAAISCIASAYRSPMVADSVLRDAARHITEVAKLRSGTRLAQRFQDILL
jgi:hypothetical protein